MQVMVIESESQLFISRNPIKLYITLSNKTPRTMRPGAVLRPLQCLKLNPCNKCCFIWI